MAGLSIGHNVVVALGEGEKVPDIGLGGGEGNAMFGRVRVGPEPGLRPVLTSVLAREVENKKV